MNCEIKNGEKQAWREVADQLADWAITNLYNRLDAFPEWNGSWFCKKEPLTKDHLACHFRGLWTVGTYTIKPGEDTCVYLAWDIDCHDETADPATNWSFAEKLYHRLFALGLRPILEDSNGKGGYHVWVVFSHPVPAAIAMAFGHWIVQDSPFEIEVFPKQTAVGDGYGNQLRVPGHHHKDDHWSRFWDGQESWLEGADAVQLLLRHRTASPDRIPAVAKNYIVPVKPTPARPETDGVVAEDWLQRYTGDLKTLDIVELCGDRLTGKRSGQAHVLICPWATEHTDSNDGAYVWEAEDNRFPTFFCHHSHCKGRRLQDLLAIYPADRVDECCSGQFGCSGHELDEAVNQIVKPAPEPTKKEPPKSDPRKRAYTISELSRLPKPTWHVHGMFTEQSCVILWGESGSGKSFLALDWALCTATGKPWLGEHKVKPGSVVYIASEGKSGLPKRCLRWLEYHEQPEPENFWIIPEAFEMVESESFADLVRVLGDLGEQHALIVIDTLNRNLGGSENDGDDMRVFTKAAELLQRAFGATVLVIHHTGWDNARERGHSSLRGNSDTMISAKKLGDRLTDGIEVKCVKQKDSDLFDTFGVACEVVGDGDDSSLVLTERIDTDKLTEERKQERQDQRLTPVLKCLPDDATRPMALPDIVEASTTPKSTCHRLLGDAINAGYVVRVGVKQPRYYLTVAGKAVVSRQTGGLV